MKATMKATMITLRYIFSLKITQRNTCRHSWSLSTSEVAIDACKWVRITLNQLAIWSPPTTAHMKLGKSWKANRANKIFRIVYSLVHLFIRRTLSGQSCWNGCYWCEWNLMNGFIPPFSTGLTKKERRAKWHLWWVTWAKKWVES